MTTLRHIWPPIVLALLALMLVGLFIFVGMFTGEYWCEDRSPWWGPPTDPNSECSGLSWSAKHPGEYPWSESRIPARAMQIVSETRYLRCVQRSAWLK